MFNDRKVCKCSIPEVKKYKAGIFCLSEDKNIILEDGKEIPVGVVRCTVDDPYTVFVKILPDKDGCCVLFHAIYKTKESKESKDYRKFIF